MSQTQNRPNSAPQRNTMSQSEMVRKMAASESSWLIYQLGTVLNIAPLAPVENGDNEFILYDITEAHSTETPFKDRLILRPAPERLSRAEQGLQLREGDTTSLELIVRQNALIFVFRKKDHEWQWPEGARKHRNAAVALVVDFKSSESHCKLCYLTQAGQEQDATGFFLEEIPQHEQTFINAVYEDMAEFLPTAILETGRPFKNKHNVFPLNRDLRHP